ncbi:MAG: hypothetical protein IJM39_03730 [Firmicutes bacterium]|nr:hypothetical protein [Bacillota bacterium]
MGFERCHPAVNLIFFCAVVAAAVVFTQPVYVALAYVCAFIYSVKRGGKKALIFDLVLIPLIVIFAYYYSIYTHFGVTVISINFIGNRMTLESLLFGFTIGVRAAAVLMWFSCIHSVFSADKVVYLFGRVSPRLSLFLSILLRMVPRIKKEAARIDTAQKGIGRGHSQGNIFMKIRNCVRIFSMMITWTIEALATASESMRSRGSMLRGRKAFSIYRFDNRDRSFVVAMFALITVTVMAIMLKQTRALYSPRISMSPVTTLSYLFYLCYAVFCLMPFALELWTEYMFRRARKTV